MQVAPMIPVLDAADLWTWAASHGLRAVAKLLRWYVQNGEQDHEGEDVFNKFMPGYTTRAMCRIASMGVEGTPLSQDTRRYIDTQYGPQMYWYMWTGNPDDMPKPRQPTDPP